MTHLADPDLFRSLGQPLLASPRVVCGYCNRDLAPGALGALTSHGCCEACAAGLLGE